MQFTLLGSGRLIRTLTAGPCLIKAFPMPGLDGLTLPVAQMATFILHVPSGEKKPAYSSCSPSLDGRMGGGRREEGRIRSRVVLRACRHLRTHIRSLNPFPACQGPSHSCHTLLPKPLGLLKLSCLLVQFHFLTRQTRAGSACSHRQAGCQLQWHLCLSEKLRRK